MYVDKKSEWKYSREGGELFCFVYQKSFEIKSAYLYANFHIRSEWRYGEIRITTEILSLWKCPSSPRTSGLESSGVLYAVGVLIW